MKIAESKAALERFIKGCGVAVESAPIDDICRACLDFYAQVRAVDAVPLEDDGEMFLFQWGRSKYDKRPDDFHIDLVRQFVAPSSDEEGQEDGETDYFQLHCTIWMPAAPFSAIANGHLWLYRPAAAAGFWATLQAHPVLTQARGQPQRAHEISLEQV